VPRSLQIVVQINEVPDPENPMRAAHQLMVGQSWIINGEQQPCDDEAVVIATLKQALDFKLAQVPFRPPSIVAVPPGTIVAPH